MKQPWRAALTVVVALLSLASSPSAAAQAAGTFALSAAPIRLEYPGPLEEWALRLSADADAAAGDLERRMGVSLPAGVLRWDPAAGDPSAGPRGQVLLAPRDGAVEVLLTDYLPRMAQDFGVGYASGYARWLSGYAVAKLALTADAVSPPWWSEGGALYLSDLLAREARATTPTLYGLEAAFVRRAQRRDPVSLEGGDLDAAGRGKAYVTFKLLESVYGEQAVVDLLGGLVSRRATDPDALIQALPAADGPISGADLLKTWLQPTTSMDAALEDVDIRNDGNTIRARIRHRGDLRIPTTLEVRCVDGQVVRVPVPASEERVEVTADIPSPPVEVVLDPDGLLPDSNRSNNRRGFGDADAIRRFFGFDEQFRIGEIDLNGEITLDESEQRVEEFTVFVENLTDRPAGLGILVSAEWTNRPDRMQRAYFTHLGPGERKVVRETLAYPNRGSGRAQVQARYWRAPDPDALTDLLISQEPGLVNSYVVLRDPPPAPRFTRSGIDRRPPTIDEARTEAAPSGPDPSAEPDETPTPAETEGESPADSAPLQLELVSPRPDTLPIGDVTLEASVRARDVEPERVDFYVNDRRIGSAMVRPYRLQWSFPDAERVFVIRAVAVAGNRLAADDVVLDRSAVGFASTVNLVTLHVTVRDSGGGLVRDLRAEDFRVIEDGADQEIQQFDFGESPVSAFLMLDLSSSMIGGGIRAERAGARRLVDSLVNEDNSAMILGFNDQLFAFSGLSHDPDELHTAIEAAVPDGSTALFDALAEALRKVNRQRGKRALVVLSDGLDTNSQFEYADVLEYIRQSDVLVYTIGLQLMHEGTSLGDASGAVKQGVDRLRAMAEVTGGAAYFPLQLDELEEIYGRIADELDAQYALSYTPTNQRWDGGWRELDVRVPGHPSYTVQARPGYYGIPPSERPVAAPGGS